MCSKCVQYYSISLCAYHIHVQGFRQTFFFGGGGVGGGGEDGGVWLIAMFIWQLLLTPMHL